MNFFTKTRVLVSIIVVLAALNLATLGTVGYHIIKSRSEKIPEMNRREQPGRFMARQMQMTDDQFNDFERSRADFMKKSNEVMNEIRKTSRLILDEIGNENPDKQKLNEYSITYGNLHMQQKQMMIDHLLEIKAKCTPQQRDHFKQFIKRMENAEMIRGRRLRNKNN